MDALKALAGQQGCSADGTAATKNPLSQFVNKVGAGGDARLGQRPGQRTDRNGVSAGMTMHQRPQIQQQMLNQQNVANEIGRLHSHPQGFAGPGPQIRSSQMPMQHQQRSEWARQFQAPIHGMRQTQPMNHQMGERWVQQMANQAARPGVPMQMNHAWRQQQQHVRQANVWNNQVINQQKPPAASDWIQEAKKTQAQVREKQKHEVDSDAIKKATEELVDVMKSDEKLRDSNFFQQMSSVANGDSIVTENEIKTVNATPNVNVKQPINDEYANMQQIFEKAYESQLAGEPVDLDAVFDDALGRSGQDMSMFENIWNQSKPEQSSYMLAEENKFSDIQSDEDLFSMGMDFFKRGELKDAVLAFQAVVDKDITNSEAWRMLGVVHQELDEDRKAIICLETAKEHDPYNLNALLELGVSYVNELDQKKALSNLKAWVENNPKFAGVQVDDIYGDESSDLMHDVVMLMAKVEEFAPQDPDVQVVMGVLFNVSRDYDSAVKSFKNALNHRPDDYSLWNKLGATLANSSKSKEALPIYTRAIELKPKYARGWLNFGISHSNLGDYSKAMRAYLRALDLNPEAVHIWSYLRICLTVCEGYEELLPAVANKDIEAFRKVFDF